MTPTISQKPSVKKWASPQKNTVEDTKIKDDAPPGRKRRIFGLIRGGEYAQKKRTWICPFFLRPFPAGDSWLMIAPPFYS
jgi:hypothetical protein